MALSIALAIRPKDLTRLEERQFDRHCTGPGDPCDAIKAAAFQAIIAARSKMNEMLQDKRGLYRNAYSVANKAVTGTSTTWLNHIPDLDGRIAAINAMISLGQKMGCDMSQEIAMSADLYVPHAPSNP